MIIHRDLKSPNILITENWTALISDFGESRIADSTMTTGVGTPQWMAPECLLGFDNYSHKSDVYSFGIILWEIITHEEPYAQYSRVQYQHMVIHENLRPPIPPFSPDILSNLMKVCWIADPNARPTYIEIIDILFKAKLQTNVSKNVKK